MSIASALLFLSGDGGILPEWQFKASMCLVL